MIMTLVKPKPVRCMVFIDGSNLYKVVRKLELFCDYKRLVNTILDKQVAVLRLPINFSRELIEKSDFQMPFPEDICKPRKKI